MNSFYYNLSTLKEVFDEVVTLDVITEKERELTVKLILSLLEDYKEPKTKNPKLLGAYWAIGAMVNTCKIYLIQEMSFKALNALLTHYLKCAFNLLTELLK